MANVIIVEKTNHICDVEQFGDKVVLTDRMNPFDLQGMQERISQELDLLNFDPKVDYICMTGKPISLAILLSTVLQIYKYARVLLFDASTSKYKERYVANV